MNVIDPASPASLVPRPRQLHDVQQFGRYPTHEYQLDQPSFQWPRRVPCLAVGFKPDTPLTRSAEPLVKFAPGRALTWVKQRAPILCPCCGAVMTIVKTQLRSLFSGPLPIPLAAQGAH